MLQDPLGLDREIQRVARSLQNFRAELRRGRGEDHAFEFVARSISHELVLELGDNAADPLGPALLRWAAHLLEEKALAELAVAHAVAFRVARHSVDAPERGEFTLAALLEHALANTMGQRVSWLRLLFERAERATELAFRRAERRAEVRASLSERVPAISFEGGTPVLEAARRWLAESRDAFSALGSETFADVLEVGLGRDSRATWPARVTARSLAELFRDAPWLEDVKELPDVTAPTLGASSFLRALFHFGAALRAGLAGGSRPFVLAHDAYGLDRATFGALFALLPANDAFARRELGVSAAAAADHRRSLARVLLVASREAALRVLLREPAFLGKRALEQAYTEESLRALGVELPPRALGVVFTPRPSDPGRFAGLLLASELATRLTESHDEDWYRNPRAVEEIRETARLPAATEAAPEALGRGAKELLRALTAAL
jgi:hypothetical protein